MITALAVDDGAKHRPEAIKTEAKAAGDGVTLSGGKLLVLDAHVADLLLVAARQGDDTALFLVDPKAQGVSIERTRMVDDRNAARVTLENVAAEPMADGAAALAAGAHGYRLSVRGLERVWANMTAEQVYRTDIFAFLRSLLRWVVSSAAGGRAVTRSALLDSTPLRRLLRLVINFQRIEESIRQGHLRALSITASSYATGESVAFFQGAAGVEEWTRARRVGRRSDCGGQHLLAAAAIPRLVPAEKVDGSYYGDGAVRQLAPVSPALHLGADKLLVVGVSGNVSADHQRQLSGYPSLAQVLGHVLNSVFVDTLEGDVERLERINRTVEALGKRARNQHGIQLRQVDVLKIYPSQPIDEIAAEHIKELPRTLRFFLSGSGATRSPGASAVSYLLFEPGFTGRLMSLGYQDAKAREDEIRAFFAPRAREKGLDFSIICEYPLPEQILTDPTRLRQIIINLCGNALKFTDKGSISLVVRCDREQELLAARVVDTGIGMKPEQLGRLFDPFAQGSAAISRQYGGTGLGLSISRRLAEMLGGSIRVNSTYGEGSEFELSIRTGPLDSVHFLRDASELSQRRRAIPMVVAPRLSGRILCAEDNDVNRRLVSLLVSRTGAELVHVSNGAEALELAIREPFDLILMDIQMPVMNGRDATAALREAGVNTPVIALTANVMSEDIADYRLAGCNEHLAKPIDKQRFYEALARYLSVAQELVESPAPRYQGKVLVAEDNTENRQLVERMLRRAGLDVLSVTTGDEAVRTALSDTVHLVLMDRHMPGMDGVAATRLLRQAGFRRPVIAFTAGDQQETDALLDAGCDGVLNKPIDQSHLTSLLDRLLGAGAVAAADASEDDEIAHLVAQFLEGLAARRARMEDALATADREAMKTEAHQIKGTAGAMGYPLMTRQAGILEDLVKVTEPDWDRVRSELRGLGEMIDRALTAAKAPG